MEEADFASGRVKLDSNLLHLNFEELIAFEDKILTTLSRK